MHIKGTTCTSNWRTIQPTHDKYQFCWVVCHVELDCVETVEMAGPCVHSASVPGIRIALWNESGQFGLCMGCVRVPFGSFIPSMKVALRASVNAVGRGVGTTCNAILAPPRPTPLTQTTRGENSLAATC